MKSKNLGNYPRYRFIDSRLKSLWSQAVGGPQHSREVWNELSQAIETLALHGLGDEEPIEFDDKTPVLRRQVIVEGSEDGFSWEPVARAPLGDLVSFDTKRFRMVRVSLDFALGVKDQQTPVPESEPTSE